MRLDKENQGIRPPGRERSAVESRRLGGPAGEIMLAARTLFERRGVGKTTVKDIAAEANVTRELVYYYFENKQAVIDAVIDRLVELRLLNDEDYARMVVRACVSRMMGMRGAVIELTRKGVDRAIAQSVAQEAAEQGVFDEAAWELGRSVARKARACSVEVQRRRFWGAGGRKGHDPQVLREVAHALFSADASEE